MNSIAPFAGIYFRFYISLFFFISLTLDAQAHDPGLSSAQVTVGNQQIDVLLGFAQRDVESVLAPVQILPTPIQQRVLQRFNSSPSPQRSSVFFGGSSGRSLVNRRHDERTPRILKFRFASKGRTLDRFAWCRAFSNDCLWVTASFYRSKPPSGAILGEAMLSAEENSLQIDLPEVTESTADSNKSHSFFAFLKLGVEHIWLGVDHLLFVFGLLLLVKSRWMLLKTVTAFTVAHSITLALATLGYAHLPGPPLNAAIAFSILILGIEIVRSRSGKTGITILHPWIVAFAFGLLHGFGFASGLSALGLPAADIPLALVMFNVGVEIGQVSFVLLILLLERSFRQLEIHWPRWVQALPGYTVGSLGAFWTIQRAAMLLGIIP